MTITLRTVGERDTAYVFALFCSVRGPELRHTEMTAAEQTAFLQTQFHAMHTQYASRFPNATHSIICVDSVPSGRIYVNESADEIRLLDIIVDPVKRNGGIGSHLISQLKKNSDTSGKPIRFYVWQSNTNAQRFYKRHGFSEVRFDGAYLLMERIAETAAAAI